MWPKSNWLNRQVKKISIGFFKDPESYNIKNAQKTIKICSIYKDQEILTNSQGQTQSTDINPEMTQML